jgi:hypothetical protein
MSSVSHRSCRAILCALLFAQLSACASYVPPASGPTARLTLIGPVSAAFVSPGHSCSTRTGLAKALWANTYIPAGGRFSVELWFMREDETKTEWCTAAISFVPRDDAKHVVTFAYDGKACWVQGHIANAAGTLEPLLSVAHEKPLSCAR